jgi:hypothetical protein
MDGTGKILSEALIFASTIPQYDDRFFIVHENCKLRIPAKHVYTNSCFCFDIQNNFGTQHALQMLRASEKYLPVKTTTVPIFWMVKTGHIPPNIF